MLYILATTGIISLSLTAQVTAWILAMQYIHGVVDGPRYVLDVQVPAFFLALRYILPTIAIISCAMMFLWPKAIWDRFVSWQYKNPESVEPSKAGLRMARIVAGVCLIIAIFIVILLVATPRS